MNPSWNSLELAKLAASLLTPVLVLVLGIVINNSIRSGERASALRSEIYKSIGGDLNDIYAYLALVGRWKEMTPRDVIACQEAGGRQGDVHLPALLLGGAVPDLRNLHARGLRAVRRRGPGCPHQKRYRHRRRRPPPAWPRMACRLGRRLHEGTQQKRARSARRMTPFSSNWRVIWG